LGVAAVDPGAAEPAGGFAAVGEPAGGTAPAALPAGLPAGGLPAEGEPAAGEVAGGVFEVASAATGVEVLDPGAAGSFAFTAGEPPGASLLVRSRLQELPSTHNATPTTEVKRIGYLDLIM
jgi:hypothetical protein